MAAFFRVMTAAPRSRLATVVLAAVAVVMAVSGLIALATLTLFLMKYSRGSTAIPVVVSDTGIAITAVPTSVHLSSFFSSTLPTLTPVTISQPIGSAKVSVPAALPLLIPMPLVDASLSLFSGPVDVPLEILIPALKIKADVLGVGLTLDNSMASPLGTYAADPIWQTVFWYRGGGIPGDAGTATFAGHFDDTLGRPAVFGYLTELHIGDVIIVRDKRTSLDISFIVTETKMYTEQEAANPDVLARVFGSQSVSGGELQPVSDHVSHLTLITCGGEWIKGSFDHRLVVYATRASYPTAG